MSELPTAAPDQSPLRIGVFMTLAALGIAALVGIIACALACLVRRRNEILALAGVAVSGLAVDLFVLAIWREIDSDIYAKIAAIAFVWTFFGLLMLGLTLAVEARASLARALYLGAMIAAAAAGLISSWLVATNGGLITPLSPFGVESISSDSLLRPLAAALVLLSTLWFGALAASRLERS